MNNLKRILTIILIISLLITFTFSVPATAYASTTLGVTAVAFVLLVACGLASTYDISIPVITDMLENASQTVISDLQFIGTLLSSSLLPTERVVIPQSFINLVHTYFNLNRVNTNTNTVTIEGASNTTSSSILYQNVLSKNVVNPFPALYRQQQSAGTITTDPYPLCNGLDYAFQYSRLAFGQRIINLLIIDHATNTVIGTQQYFNQRAENSSNPVYTAEFQYWTNYIDSNDYENTRMQIAVGVINENYIGVTMQPTSSTSITNFIEYNGYAKGVLSTNLIRLYFNNQTNIDSGKSIYIPYTSYSATEEPPAQYTVSINPEYLPENTSNLDNTVITQPLNPNYELDIPTLGSNTETEWTDEVYNLGASGVRTYEYTNQGVLIPNAGTTLGYLEDTFPNSLTGEIDTEATGSGNSSGSIFDIPILGWIFQALKSLWDLIKHGINLLISWIQSIINAIQGISADILNFWNGVPEKISDIKNLLQQILNAIGGIAFDISEFLVGILAFISGYTLYQSIFTYYLPTSIATILWAFWLVAVSIYLLRMIIDR